MLGEGGREVWGEAGKDPLGEATCEAYFWKLLFQRSYYRRMGHSQDSEGFHSGNAPCPSKRNSETPPGKRRAFPPKADGLSPVPCLSYTATVQAKMEPAGPSRDPRSPTAAGAPVHWATGRDAAGAHLRPGAGFSI